MKKVITRREFMQQSAVTVAGTAVALSSKASTPKRKSRVVLIRREEVLDADYNIDKKVVQQMLDEAVMSLFDKKDPITAFRHIIKPTDVVGIKSNVWNYLPTPKELEQAIKSRLLDAGVKSENLGIDDHDVRSNPVFQKATALINVRPLRTHHLAGMSGCIKNYIMFAENCPAYHPNNCADLAKLFQLPMVAGKSQLHVLSILTSQFHGRGPHSFNQRFVWPYKGLLVGTDPVAVDSVGLRILLAKRKEHFKDRYKLRPTPRYIQLADIKHKLGTSDSNQIELIRLGWKDGILI